MCYVSAGAVAVVRDLPSRHKYSSMIIEKKCVRTAKKESKYTYFTVGFSTGKVDPAGRFGNFNDGGLMRSMGRGKQSGISIR
jgi:hypothetical protein